MLRITASKKGGRLQFHREDQYREWMTAQEDNQVFRIEIKAMRATKTLRQLAYYYGVVVPSVIRWMDEQGWDSIGSVEICGTRVPLAVDIENADRYLKVIYATSRGIEYQIKKARMTIREMTDYLNFILSWAHDNGISIPSPEDF